jgi:Penicillin amidase
VEPEPILVDTTAAPRPGRGDSFVADMAALEMSSNALLVSADESASGTPLAVMGPQVGYFNPSALMEQDIHAPASAEGPAIDARGVAFAGANLYVQLGRGQDYSWSATSAGQDITDTFALELCDPEGGTVTLQSDHYLYDGECLPFEEVERTNSWTPSLADPTPAGTETIRALRTELGLVTHRAMVDEVPTAYTQLRATYFHEADSATGFADFNSPDRVASSADFRQAANKIDYTFNWFYADNQDIAYFNSGANPVRAENTDPNLPIMGAPEFAWEGYDPEDLTFDRAPFAEHAQVENQDYLTNWNNKQAPGFRASDDSYSYGSVHRSEPLDDRILEEIEGPGLMTRAELVDAAEDAATVDLRGDKVLVYALRVIRGGPALKNKKVRRAAKALAQWERAGAHRRDPDGNGVYARSRAIRLMDAWWPRLVTAQFRGPLGADLYESVESMMGIDNRPGASGSAYGSGWYGYVEKDLRSVLGLSVEGAFSREYCGGGSLAECRRLLRRSFARAVKNSAPEDVYPGEDCPEGNLQWCNDAIRHTEFGVIRQPRIHWQNRPTFQQVVEVQGHR